MSSYIASQKLKTQYPSFQLQWTPQAVARSIIVSYFEWVQNKKSENWDLAKVDGKLKKLILRAYDRTIKQMGEHNTDMRTAAYVVALKRIEMVYEERGIFP